MLTDPIYHYVLMVGIFLTAMTVCIGACVCVRWLPNWIEIAKKPRDQRMSADWFIRGVFSGFMKFTIDSGYWLIPWTLFFLKSPHATVWMAAGIYVNIMVRQSIGIFSARCHLKASEKFIEERGLKKYKLSVDRITLISAIIGAIFVTIVNLYAT